MIVVVGFSTHKGFAPLSWIIRRCEGTDFSHAYLKIRSDSLDRDLIYQATGAGVNFVGTRVFEETAQVIEEYEVEISDDKKKQLLQWCVDNSGKPYGRLQIIGLGLIRLAKLFGIRIKNPFPNGSGAYVCCELVWAALEQVGMAKPGDLDQVDLNATRDMVRLVA